MPPLTLDRPLVIFDIESTGVNPRLDRIIDLAFCKIFPDGRTEERFFRFHPEIPIPAEAAAIHGITDADVAGCPPFRDKAFEVLSLIQNCDLAGFGITRFDVPLLAEEFARAGVPFDPDAYRMVDAQRIYHRKEPRDLTAALAFFCGEAHTGAHGAVADVEATRRVIEAQLQRYGDLPSTVEGLHAFCNPPRNAAWADKHGRLKWVNGEITINFGTQYLGQKLRDLAKNNPKLLKWLLKSDFPSDTKRIVTDALQGKFPPAPLKPGEDTAP